MRVIDEARLEMPYAGARKIRAELRRHAAARSTCRAAAWRASWRR